MQLSRLTTPALFVSAAVLLSACMGQDYANRAAFIETPVQGTELGFDYAPLNINNLK